MSATTLRLTENKFELNPYYVPAADQPQARDKLGEGLAREERFQTLLGVTGSGKTATMAFVIEQAQRPALVIAHNKTLAAQLCNEFRDLFPKNAVEYFVSYYDYYQPEAYLPSKDLYFEKDSQINEEITRLRHAATSALLSRRDTIIVASVSCIYGMGSPEAYGKQTLTMSRGDNRNREEVLKHLVGMQYSRNDQVLERGKFRVRGETLEIQPPSMESSAYRVLFFGDEVEEIELFHTTTGDTIKEMRNFTIWPATHYATDPQTIKRSVSEIREELHTQQAQLLKDNKLVEEQRLTQRTEFDIEMLEELGYCNGIENYSRILDARSPGQRPYCLIDYFPKDFITFIDESHQTIPQIRGMHAGDKSRKTTLVDYGFRLPSALDNRPQTFNEFLSITDKMILVSATPGDFEDEYSFQTVEQIVRPTGIVDPPIEVRPTKHQIDDLANEIKIREEKDERVLITTLTKKMAENLSAYLLENGFKVKYLHSDIDTLERIKIIRELRLGEFDVLVGVNLLREGLDLPEVSLVAILDADKEGFLRGETALIQTIGRAARNQEGMVIMYADKESRAMKSAISETDRRRKIQEEYNKVHNITPTTIKKGISDISDFLANKNVPKSKTSSTLDTEKMTEEDIQKMIITLEEEMLLAADELRFEYAAKLRDEIKQLQAEVN